MSGWVLGLGVAAGYLIKKNILSSTGVLENAAREFNNATPETTGGATSAEVRQAWANTDFARFGDMREDLSESQKLDLDRKREQARSQVESYETGSRGVDEIQGVMMTYDRSEC